MTDADLPRPGWYPDPEVPGGRRYWDGTAWTDQRVAPDPPRDLPAGAAATGSTPSWAGAGPGFTTPAGTAPAIDTWLWQSIVATMLCCMPLGIVGIVFSAQAGSARDAGNWEVAQRRAAQARTWTLASVFTVLGFFGIGLLLAVVGAASGW